MQGTVVCLHPELTEFAHALASPKTIVQGEMGLGPRPYGVWVYPKYLFGFDPKKRPERSESEKTIIKEREKRTFLVYDEDKKFFGAWPRPEELGFPAIYLPKPVRFQDALSTIREVGKILRRETSADELVKGLETRIQKVRADTKGLGHKKLFMEARAVDNSPHHEYYYPLVTGEDPSLDEIIEWAGGLNVIQHRGDLRLPATQDLGKYLRQLGGIADPPFDSDRMNPEVIIITHGRISPVSRPGWSRVSAVREKRVYRLGHPVTWEAKVDFLEMASRLLQTEFYSHSQPEQLEHLLGTRVPDQEYECMDGHTYPSEVFYCPMDGSRMIRPSGKIHPSARAGILASCRNAISRLRI